MIDGFADAAPPDGVHRDRRSSSLLSNLPASLPNPLRPPGTVVLVGVPTPDMTLEIPLVDFFSRGGALKSSWYGDCLPERDFPTLISLYMQGRLPLEKFVSERIGLGDIEDAFHKMHSGEVLRSVVVWK